MHRHSQAGPADERCVSQALGLERAGRREWRVLVVAPMTNELSIPGVGSLSQLVSMAYDRSLRVGSASLI